MSYVDTDAHHLSSDTSKRKTDSYVRQRQECPPTSDTRLTDGSRVACEAASACKRRRNRERITHQLW